MTKNPGRKERRRIQFSEGKKKGNMNCESKHEMRSKMGMAKD